MNIGFVGAGNIASAIINGVVQSGSVNLSDISIYDVSKAVTEKYHHLGYRACKSLDEILDCDILFLTVKPQYYNDVLAQMGSIQNKIIVTVAPGIKISHVKSFLDPSNKVVRTMPNTPLMVGEGMTVLSKDELITEMEFQLIKGLFETAGKVLEINENLMDACVGVTSSSPAYVYMLIEALADGGVYNGIDRASAIQMAAQAVYGTAKVVLETNEHPATLKDRVCSPNGTTIRAVKALEDHGFRSAILNAMEECFKRSKELGE